MTMTNEEIERRLLSIGDTLTDAGAQVQTILEGMRGTPPPPPPPSMTPCEDVVAGEQFVHEGLLFTAGAHNGAKDCQIRFALPRKTYTKVAVAFDVSIPANGYTSSTGVGKTHFPLLWLQPTRYWANMLAYLLSVVPSGGRTGGLRFSSNWLDIPAFTNDPKMAANRKYRATLVINTDPADRVVRYKVESIDPGPRVTWQFTRQHLTQYLSLNSDARLVFGQNYYTAMGGPEGITEGWEYSNLRVEWVP